MLKNLLNDWLNYWINALEECGNDFDSKCMCIIVFVLMHAVLIGAAIGVVVIWLEAPIVALVLTAIFGLPSIVAIYIWKKSNEGK